MAKGAVKQELTEDILALHDQALERDFAGRNTWVEKVVREERIHLFYSQAGTCSLEAQLDMDNDGHYAPQPIHDHPKRNGGPALQPCGVIDTDLKLFKQGQEVLLTEEPLERFLTPDGCSDPPFFARPALAKLDMPFGSAETMDDRKRKARSNAEMAKARKKTASADGPTGEQSLESGVLTASKI
ncbi:hypothetical protein VTN02DRAFT_3597 [Thermoascus thermophilus]